ncbi:hypothetical protein MCOR25_009820 [Pyricularia grisea]|nr:hypothetical protein MCOR25_009820 [Pyricularia grisea]
MVRPIVPTRGGSGAPITEHVGIFTIPSGAVGSFVFSNAFSRSNSNEKDDHVDDPKGPLGLTVLFTPEEPRFDLIFVHGLGGGSRKTWSKTSQRDHFWPQEWLPKDPSFRHVRIQTFGYDSDYLKGGDDFLNVHHFGKSFLAALSTSPCLLQSTSPIVIVAHSMGGLVSKKAYILAMQDAAHNELAKRFAAIYFLATPHRGADSAKLLNNILKVAYDRSYVADLKPNSGTIQIINDEFRHYSSSIQLWSFYETKSMKFSNTPIVDPESALLNYPEEKQTPMEADHRSICKFESVSDPNYQILRNALSATFNEISSTRVSQISTVDKSQETSKSFRKQFGIVDDVDNDLVDAREARIGGSCQWIFNKTSYFEWESESPSRASVLWVSGMPASGKSVLAGSVIDRIRGNGLNCSYYFFKHAYLAKTSLGRCLRSLAYQMACLDTSSGNIARKLLEDGICLDDLDDRAFWRAIKTAGFFSSTKTPHYWVIDALDECNDPSFLLQSILPNLGDSMPLKLLITSRYTAKLNEGFASVPVNRVRSPSITAEDTISDLGRVVDSRMPNLRVVSADQRDSLAEKILQKGKGSFLWTTLVLAELELCHSKKEIDRVLEEIPRGMKPVYRRTLETMSQASRGKPLSKAILMWVACAVRPLSLDELNEALSLDIKDTFPRLKESIAALCGQLVVIDKSGRAQMVHESAREFVLSDRSISDFYIEPGKAHMRISQVCLEYLTGDEMKPPRGRRGPRVLKDARVSRTPFARYALESYSHHLAMSCCPASETLPLLENFLKLNVLTWIAEVAGSGRLGQLTLSSKHLKSYADNLSNRHPELKSRIQVLNKWVTDLVRIPAVFGTALLASPSAIYATIPPFCPRRSMIRNTTGISRQISVLGDSPERWDDRLFCLNFQPAQPTSVCYGDELLAVGLRSGTVTLYFSTSHQKHKSLDHGESVRFIAFKSKSDLMATCGMKVMKVWDVRTGTEMHSFECPPHPMGIGFYKESLLVACRKNYVASWDLTVCFGEPLQIPWTSALDVAHSSATRTPSKLDISVSHGLLAVAYFGRPIILWDLEEESYIGSCGKKLSNGETSTHAVVALAFSPNPIISLLAVAYLDGELAVLDPLVDEELKSLRADCDTLAASPNGHLLAAGGARGVITVYKFGTLQLLYRVKSTNTPINGLAFSQDSTLLADIRSTQCTVWEPDILSGNTVDDGGNSGTAPEVGVQTLSMVASTKILMVVTDPSTNMIICGKEDGYIDIYDRRRGLKLQTLECHKRFPLRLMAWCGARNALVSLDCSNRLLIQNIGTESSTEQTESADTILLFECRIKTDTPPFEFLVEGQGSKMVISTHTSDHMLDLYGNEPERRREWAWSESAVEANRKWVHLPQSPHQVALVDRSEIRIYNWSDWSEVAVFPLATENLTVHVKAATIFSGGHNPRLFLEVADQCNLLSTRRLLLFDASRLEVAKGSRKGASLITGLDEQPRCISGDDCNPSISLPEMDDQTQQLPLLDLGLQYLDGEVSHPRTDIGTLDIDTQLPFSNMEPPGSFTRYAPGSHADFMNLAIEEARKSRPEPGKFRVGAVLVDEATGNVLTRGYYLEYPDGHNGSPGSVHAERVCIIKAAELYGVSEAEVGTVLPPNCAVYTTMEPCIARPSRDKSCVDRLLEVRQAVGTVYVGIRMPGTSPDADEPVMWRLEARGITVLYPLPEWKSKLTNVAKGEE